MKNNYTWGLANYELRARLSLLTLTVDNDEEDYEDRLQWVGTTQQWNSMRVLENELMNTYDHRLQA